MCQNIFLIACLCGISVAYVSAYPYPANNQELDVLQIPLTNGKEIDVLTLGNKDQEQAIAERNKRTIGLLRELFPEITKNVASETQIDLSAINKQLEETIRVARQVKEAEAAAQAVANMQKQQQQPQQTQQSEPQQQPEQQQQPSQPQEQKQPDQSDQQSKLEEAIQLTFNNEVLNNNNNDAKPVSNDLQISESKSPAIDDLSLDSNEDQADLDDRNKSNLFKRFLNFGGGGGLAGSASGTNANVNAGAAGGPGSGNFLFDIVRLFSGSVQTQNRDEAANSPKNTIGGSSDDNDSNNGGDGYTEGIPGPVTRLVVLANRGLANLVQDMILRVAATSEKFVNFNAKLLTALI